MTSPPLPIQPSIKIANMAAQPGLNARLISSRNPATALAGGSDAVAQFNRGLVGDKTLHQPFPIARGN